MVFLGGIGEALILKWVGGKLMAGLGSHLAASSSAAVTNFAMHGAIVASSSAQAAYATGGGAAALTALGHSAQAHHALYQEMEKAKNKAQSGNTNTAPDDDATQAMLMIGMVMALLADGYYHSLEHKGMSGAVKTTLGEIEPCGMGGCSCKDLVKDGATCKTCGHYSSLHDNLSEDDLDTALEMVDCMWKGIAEEIYPLLKNRDGEGDYKRLLSSIDTCTVDDCECWDFDLSEANTFFSRRCSCDHRFREHMVTGEWHWIVALLAQRILLEESS